MTERITETEYWSEDRKKDEADANCQHLDSEELFHIDSDVAIGKVCHDCGLEVPWPWNRKGEWPS